MRGTRAIKTLALLVLLCVLGSGLSASLGQPESAQTITAATMDELEFGFIARTSYCDAFSEDDRLLGNYDLLTGQPLFHVNNYTHGLSPLANVSIDQPDIVASLPPETRVNDERLYVRPENNLLIIQRLGVFELLSGRRQIDMLGWAELSEDGSLVAIPAVGIYRVRDGSLVLPLDGDVYLPPSISPDNSVFAVSSDGLYDLNTGEQRFPLPGANPVFSPDSRWVATSSHGVYDTQTGERVITLDDNAPYSLPQFSPDSRWLAFADGLYDVDAQERAFDFPMLNKTVFSPDSQLVVGADGIYVIPSGERLISLDVRAVNFNVDGSLIASANGNIYHVETGEIVRTMLGSPTFSPGGTLLSVSASPYCLIYGLPDHAYPYRSGLVQPNTGINIRRLPSTQSGVLRSTGDLLAVTAQTEDHAWYKVFYDGTVGWVAANAVRIVEMPEGVPIESR